MATGDRWASVSEWCFRLYRNGVETSYTMTKAWSRGAWVYELWRGREWLGAGASSAEAKKHLPPAE